MATRYNSKKPVAILHQGYYQNNTLASFTKCCEVGCYFETDVVITADGTNYINHNRTGTVNGVEKNVSTMTDAEFETCFPNAPKATVFLQLMQQNPNICFQFDGYGGTDQFLALANQYGVIPQIALTLYNKPTANPYPQYEDLSYVCCFTDTTKEGTDHLRTPYNNLFGDGIYMQTETYNYNSTDGIDGMLSAIDAGATRIWVGSFNDSEAQAITTAINTYNTNHPNYNGYDNDDMLDELADAIKEKLSITDKLIPLRNFASIIRKFKLKGNSSGDEGKLSITLPNSTSAAYNPQLKGWFPNVLEVEIDFNHNKSAMIQCGYANFGSDNSAETVINVKNSELSANNTDILRNAVGVKELNFVNGYYPTSFNRWFQNFNYDTTFENQPTPNTLKVTGVYMDNVTSAGWLSGFSGQFLDFIAEGTINNSLDLGASSKALTGASVNSLLNALCSDGTDKVLKVSSVAYARASDTAKTSAVAKGWTITTV